MPEEIELCDKIIKHELDGKDAKKFNEGDEPDEFWTALGGHEAYDRFKQMKIFPGFEPRLFNCSNASGYFFVKEIPNFAQTDLINDDVYILDCYSTIYVWIGNLANKTEVKNSWKSAQKYLDSIEDSRDKDDV